jgi:hypothetical protein
MILLLLLAQLTAPTVAPKPMPPHIPSVESLPAQDISCELRSLDFEETARIAFRQSGGRAFNRERPGDPVTPSRTPVTIEVLADDTRVLEKSYTTNEAPIWLGLPPFKIGGNWQYLRFQPVPPAGRPGLLIGSNNSIAYVVDIVIPQGVGQLVGRCDVKAKKQAPLSAAETREFLRQ